MLSTNFRRRLSRLCAAPIALLAVAAVGPAAKGAPAGAVEATLWVVAGGRDVEAEAEVQGLPEPAIGSRATTSGEPAASARITGRRVHHPIRVEKRHDETLSPILSRAYRSGRPLEMRIQGVSASGRLTTWRLHATVVKTFICPSDDGGHLPSSRKGGNTVAIEEIVLSAERIELE